ncbi:MAG: Guanine/hypoxanthine permease PbuO [Candidatus Marinimicrobia bacterium]|nr:Guanine/hypoxanthine permease PbuO [Candidatus Neomarinimicrobiota bacterium]
MEQFFRLKENGTSVRTEVIAGITTFLAAMYIIVVNPAILSDAGMPFNGVLTATVIVLVGVFMMKPVQQINWREFDDAIPAFFSLTLIPLTYSITQGIIWGFLSWTVVKLALGKTEEVTPMLLIIDVFAILALFV